MAARLLPGRHVITGSSSVIDFAEAVADGAASAVEVGDRRIFVAAVMKATFVLTDTVGSKVFRYPWPGVLRGLGMTDAQVDDYTFKHRDAVTLAARSNCGD